MGSAQGDDLNCCLQTDLIRLDQVGVTGMLPFPYLAFSRLLFHALLLILSFLLWFCSSLLLLLVPSVFQPPIFFSHFLQSCSSPPTVSPLLSFFHITILTKTSSFVSPSPPLFHFLCLPTVPETTGALPPFSLRNRPKREHGEKHPQQLPGHAHAHDKVQPEGGGRSSRKPQDRVKLHRLSNDTKVSDRRLYLTDPSASSKRRRE